MKHSIKYMIMEEPPAPDGTGAGGGADILDGNTPPPAAKEEPSGTVEEGWLAGVDKSFAEDSSLKNIQDLPSLVKSYVNAQKLIGKDKVVLPSEHATDEERREFLHKLGLPTTQEEYGVSQGEDSKLSEEFAKGFVEKAYEQGIMPSAAKEMLGWYEGQMQAMETHQIEAHTQEINATVENLKTKYGQAYDSKIDLANTVLAELAGPEQVESMRESGLLSNQHFIETVVGLSEKLVQEGTFTHEPKTSGRYTPSEAQEKINQVMGDLSHPYHTKAHPNHKHAIKEMETLFQMVV